MFTKRILLIALPVGLVLANPAFADDGDGTVKPITVSGGTVQFQGSIVNAPCTIDNDSAHRVVDLGQYRVDSFSGTGSTSSAVPFYINLIGCSAETYSTAAITFNGITADGNNKALSLAARQAGDTTAGGVGIQVLQDNKVLALDGTTPSAPKPFDETGVRLGFQAQYIALNQTVTPGSANAVADFTITYQ